MRNNILFYLFTIILICVCVLSAAPQGNLSRNGSAHLKAAEMLKGMMATTDDKLQVAEEYEKVVESAPGYAPAYLEAAKIYSALTSELGERAYHKAKSLFNSYAELNPSDGAEIDAELIVLEALLKKHSNGPAKADGTWVQWSNGKRFDVLEVKNNGSSVKLIEPNSLFATSHGNVRDVDISLNGFLCSIIVKVFQDERSALREKGWSHYLEDCDGNADPGFPRYGQYKFNESLTTWHYTVNLAEIPLVMECEKIHTDYYLDGSNTYSDTDQDRMIVFRRELTKKF